MTRRLAGLLVVLFTIVGVAAAATPGDRLPGTAAAVEFPGPPSAGDCLIDPLDGATRFPFERDRQVPQYGPCAGHMTLGEVIAVRSPAPANLGPGLDESVGCRAETLTYAGLVSRADRFGLDGQVPGDPVSWEYSIPATTGWIGQVPWSPRASAWAACVASPMGHERSVNSLAGAFSGGLLPDEYGTCWKSREVDTSMRMVNCALPHAAELVSIGRIVDAMAVPWSRLVDSCTDQARRVMHRDDPTVGGLLTMQVEPDGAIVSARTRNLTCFVTAADDRFLMGSVIGMRHAQLRFAG
jgi:hypothetical protein